MAIDRRIVGKSTGRSRVVVERGPVAAFARAVRDDQAVYSAVSAAREAGFRDVPAPPTYGFSALAYWGAFPDRQPPVEPEATNALADVFGPLAARGGIVLHGEEEFVYHRPICVGDVLVKQGRVVDLYEKESKGKTMTFMVTEDEWRDEATGELVLTTRMNLIHRA